MTAGEHARYYVFVVYLKDGPSVTSRFLHIDTCLDGVHLGAHLCDNNGYQFKITLL